MNLTKLHFSSVVTSEASNASTVSPAPSGESEKSRTTGGFSSEIGPQSFAYFLSVTFLTTAPQVESSSFTSSFSSVTIFSGTEGLTASRALGALATLEALETLELLELLESLATLSTLFDAISAWARAACFAASFDFPISLKMYHASTAPSTRQINFSVLFISYLSKSFFHRPFAGTGSYP